MFFDIPSKYRLSVKKSMIFFVHAVNFDGMSILVNLINYKKKVKIY